MQTKTKTTNPAPKPDEQPVQAAYTAKDYHSARVEGSYATAAEIAEELARSPGLAPSIRAFRHLARAARMRAKAQPVQAVSSTPETDAAQFFLPNAIGRVAGIVSVTLAQQLERQRNDLQLALEAIHEAGRMSDQPRAVYCSLIAQDALTAAKGGAQ